MSDTLSVGIFGRGRLGQAIAAALRAEAGLHLAWQLGRDGAPEAVPVAIDASVAAAVPGHLEWALETGTDLVIGATGWSLEDLEARVSHRIGVLVAPNFSLSVALMKRLSGVLARFAAQGGGRDLWLLEHHHRGKADAPSGTARHLAQTLLESHPAKTEIVSAQHGPIAPHQLSVGVLRAGSEFGTHTVGIDAPAESLTLSHSARSRAAFAEGALAAARWLHGRKGLFSFDLFAAEFLNPLFDLEVSS